MWKHTADIQENTHAEGWFQWSFFATLLKLTDFSKTQLIVLLWVLSLKKEILCVSKWCFLSAWNTKLWCSTRLRCWTHILTTVYVKDDLPQASLETGFYLYADNTCISDKYKDFKNDEAALNKAFSEPVQWIRRKFINLFFS